MNNAFVRWLLDLDVIPAGAEGLRLTWERPWPGWTWALIVFALAGFAAWSYARLEGRRGGRVALAGARTVVLLLVCILVSGPAIELPRESVEEDWVLVLVDRSASMGVADQGSPGARQTRDEQLAAWLDDAADTWTAIDENRQLIWMGFHRGAFELTPTPGATVDDTPPPSTWLGEADGKRTRLNAALEQALQRAAARRLSGVVLFSDGQTPDPPTRALIRRLQAESVRVHVAPLGAEDAVGDLAIRRIDAPSRAFVRDKVPITVELDAVGAGGTLSATVRLVDALTGEVLDETTTDEADGSEITLTAEPDLAGETSWRVEIDAAQADLVPENNTRSFAIELIDRPLRVLYIDGYPRWEYRFLKDLLVREKSIESSVMLLSADRDFAQEGNVPITRLPRSPEEFAAFDVMIIGDVPAPFFTNEQFEMMREHVASNGAGLLWIGGMYNTPNTYTGAALADLLPMRGSLSLGRVDRPVFMAPTPLADRLGVLQLTTAESEGGWPSELLDPRQDWAQLQFAQQVDRGRLKPAVEVLAESHEPSSSQDPVPLVMHMRYGAGQTIYVATDEIWRWRFGRGELLPEQFWVQMIRMLGRDRVVGADSGAELIASPRRLSTGQPVRLDVRILDAALLDAEPREIAVTIETAAGDIVGELRLPRVEGGAARYGRTYVPDAAGELIARVTDPRLADLDLQAPIEVLPPDDELRRPETNHALLASLATETGGRVLAPSDLPNLASSSELLPNRSVTTVTSLVESIWDSPLAFMLVLLALTCEWVGRKVIRLV